MEDIIGNKFTWNAEKFKKLENLAESVSKIIERSEQTEIQQEYEVRIVKK